MIELEQNLRKAVDSLTQLTRLNDLPAPETDDFYRNYYSLMLDYGQPMSKVGNCPDGFKGEPKDCFRNAGDVAMCNNRYLYCQGYGGSKKLGYFPVEHGWLYDTERRCVVEPTWPDSILDLQYYGIAFETEWQDNDGLMLNTGACFMENTDARLKI